MRLDARCLRVTRVGLVICGCCGKKLQGNIARGLAFYRCKASTDYQLLPDGHPASLAVREDRLLPHVDAWLAKILPPTRSKRRPAKLWRQMPKATERTPLRSRVPGLPSLSVNARSPGTWMGSRPAYRPT